MNDIENFSNSEVNNFYRKHVVSFIDKIKQLRVDIIATKGKKRVLLLDQLKIINESINKLDDLKIFQTINSENTSDKDEIEYSDIDKEDIDNDSDNDSDDEDKQIDLIEFNKFKTFLDGELSTLYKNSVCQQYM